MITAKSLLARQAAQEASQAEDDIADVFPEPGEYDRRDVEAGVVPEHFHVASFEPGAMIDLKRWVRLTPAQQQWAQASLSSRGLFLYRRGGRLVAVLNEMQGSPAEACGLRPDYMFEIGADDDRIRHSDDIQISVFHCRTEAEARQKLRTFLRDIAQTGVKVV